MKKLLILLSVLVFTACVKLEDKVPVQTINLEGVTEQANNYPKRVNIINPPLSGAVEYFEVYLGSDGHEYQLHEESHIDDQYTHYAGCNKCKIKTEE